MKYDNVKSAKFIDRPNRFIADVFIDDKKEKVHVPNTGRCKELLITGADVFVCYSDNPKRKLPYSLISVYKKDKLVNIDSQNPNRLAKEALEKGNLLGFVPDIIRREYAFGKSKIDLMFDDKIYGKGLIEVKGCTLEKDGVALFPDAPTKRGVKHLYELIQAQNEGWQAYVIFVIQMKGVSCFSPNADTHPEFAEALKEAKAKGVKILAFDSIVTPREVVLDQNIDVLL